MSSRLLLKLSRIIILFLTLIDQSIYTVEGGNCFYLHSNNLCYDISEMDVTEDQCTGSYYSDDILQELDGYIYAENCRDVNVISPERCDVDCGLGQECQWINGEEMCVCSESSCLSSNIDRTPVCGSNNMSFSSECAMEAWKCLNHRSGLYKKYDGECQKDCQNVKCPHDKVCLLVKNTGEPMCYPKIHCNPSLDPEPVCGTDGVTYSNVCAMRLAIDRQGRQPELAHKGSCENECRSGLCQSYERCVYSKQSRPVCIRCQFIPRFSTHSGECSSNIPVCGNNGYLYKNYCLLLLDQCKKKQYIDIIDYGTCPSKKRKNLLENKLDSLETLLSF